MLNFPIFKRLDIWNYGLFPGNTDQEPGLHIEFPPGITLVIGANGLGKTTLVTILFRMLTGPFDIPGLTKQGYLGNTSLELAALSRKERTLFAQRVLDNARDARARLEFSLGERSILIERRLHDLALLSLTIGNRALPTDEISSFQSEIPRLVGLASFSDWILLLRHLVFYLEDRRALVWDPSAQRQILRFLFLPPELAQKWTDSERRVLTLDSHVRNLLAVLNRQERLLSETEVKAEAAPGVREELRTLEELQEVAFAQREKTESDHIDLDSERQQARLRLLTIEQEHEDVYREFERAKLLAIDARFPNLSETSRYILAHLLSEDTCLACGSSSPSAAADLNMRLEQHRCLICGTDFSLDQAHAMSPELADRRVDRAAQALADRDQQLLEARRGLDEAEHKFRILERELSHLSLEVVERARRIEALMSRLPPEETSIHEKRSHISAMRATLSNSREDLSTARSEFSGFIESISRQLVSHAEEVKQAFDKAAEGFLLEQCHLILSTQKQQIGQTGSQIEFPVFELDMTGSNFASPVRRTGPEQVSESQREFIDIAFRMSLMEVTGHESQGTLIIDAPESSLDAVFTNRAATVLAQYSSRAHSNRLLITSNLVEGRLIPNLAEKTRAQGDNLNVVDLLSIAVPTAAVRELRHEYESVRDSLLSGGQVSG